MILYVENLKKSYGTKEVLKGVFLQAGKGESVAVLGENGAGKTTMLRICATLLKPDSGSVRLFKADPYGMKNCREIRRKIGYVGQDSERSAYARLTVTENLKFFGQLMGLPSRVAAKRTAMLAGAFEMEEILNEQFMKLSGGQKQTVVIMRALLHDPDLLFLDEPTKGLDPSRAQKIRRFIRQYVNREGKTLILTSHILEDIETMADRVVFLNNGKMIMDAAPGEACASLGYSDVIKIENMDQADRTPILQRIQLAEDDRIIKNGTELVIGTNEFYHVIEQLKDMEQYTFSHHKVNLEDVFFRYAGQEAE